MSCKSHPSFLSFLLPSPNLSAARPRREAEGTNPEPAGTRAVLRAPFGAVPNPGGTGVEEEDPQKKPPANVLPGVRSHTRAAPDGDGFVSALVEQINAATPELDGPEEQGWA